MSKQTDIFNYSQGKRNLGHSKFDMSFTNVRTQNFGQLLPVAVYETLPDDYWNIGSDGVTLLKPLSAPAFTSIKQHFYAFYTRNQQIWKHWNNFITNGTEMGQVYGSNQSNQAADSPWKVPYIPAKYLQDICKIAHGYALSINEVDVNVGTAANGNLSFISSCLKNASSSKRYDVTDLVLLVCAYSVNYSSLVSTTKEFYEFILECAEKYFIRFFIKGSNLLVMYDMPMWAASTLTYFLRGGYDTASGSWASTFGVDTDSDVEVTSSSLSVTRVAMLYDDYASECVLSNSPFVVNQITEYSPSTNQSFKNFERVKRSKGVQINNLGTSYSESGVGTAAVEIYSGVFMEKSEGYFWGCRYVFDGSFYHDVDSEDHVEKVVARPSYTMVHGFDYSTQFYWEYELSYKDAEDTEYSGPWTYLDASKAANDLLPLIPTTFGGSLVSALLPFVKAEDFSTGYPEVPGDLYFHLYNFSPYVDSQAGSQGYTSVGFMYYLCRNSASLLDSMHIPDVALATRGYKFYAFERFNALPFMAYSHIWEDHFRNRAVSSPELDYSGVNGSIFSDSSFYTWLNGCKDKFTMLPSYAEDVDFTNVQPNSWSLHFDAMPRNGLSPDFAIYGDEIASFFDGTRHYFSVASSYDVFSLLTGCALFDVILNRLFNSYRSTISYDTFSELFTKNFYLPNFYNGLLHCKYQNFNKDYFTSGMLDPMSGANDLSLGSTISELRVSEIKQSWFERIAQNRTVRAFMQRIFGITPIEEPKESRLLGVDHVPIKIGEVIQTSQTTETSVQGQRTGLGGGRGGHGLVHDRCNEHGWLIILSSFTVESQYMQGLDRTFEVKDSYMDYPTVDFAHIGNESILMKELNFDGPSVGGYPQYYGLDFRRVHNPVDGPSPVGKQDVSVNPWRVVDLGFSSHSYNQHIFTVNNVVAQSGTGIYNVFGYIPRYSSYKFKLDEVHGEFRDELAFWHTFRRFHTMPMLSHSFVNWEMLADDNEFNRLFAVSKDDVDAKFCCQTFFNASVSRALPYVCVPKSTI